MAASAPTIEDVRTAAGRLEGLVSRTPLIRSGHLSDLVRGDVWLKLESLQPTRSFKVRGAANALAVLQDERPDVRAVVTASAGNHGAALAWAAQRLGFRVKVYLPASAPAAKREQLRRLGAHLVDAPTYDEAERRAIDEAGRSHEVYISPYNNRDVIAGAGTVALEMFADDPDLDVVVVPLGGGGLLAGTAIAAHARRSRVRVIGAEAEASQAFTAALAAGRTVTIDVQPTLADGLAGNLEPDSQTFPLVRDLADHVAVVTEASIASAIRDLAFHDRLIAEGSGATAVGALLQGGLDLSQKHVGIILTGGNIDEAVLRRVLCDRP
jgi:threonine dehydratase